MPEARLTKALVAKATYGGEGGRPFYLWDEEEPRLALRVYPSGKRSWVARYKDPSGRWLNPRVIGDPARLEPAAARKRAARIAAESEEGDILPETERKTVAELYQAYDHLRISERQPKTQDEYRRSWRLHILPRFGRLPVRKLTPTLLANMKREMAKTPAAFNRAMATLHAAYVLAERVLSPAWVPPGYNPADPHKVERPTEEAKKKRRPGVRTHFAPAELAAIGKAIGVLKVARLPRAKQRRHILRGIELMMLNGSRPCEIFGTEKAWVRDVETDLARIEPMTAKDDHGGGTSRTIALGPISRAIMAEALVEADPESRYIWKANRAAQDQPLKDIYGVWRQVLETAGIEYVRPYLLRHTYRTRARLDLNANTDPLNDQMGHSTVDHVYRHAELEAQALLASEVEGHIYGMMTGEAVN